MLANFKVGNKSRARYINARLEANISLEANSGIFAEKNPVSNFGGENLVCG